VRKAFRTHDLNDAFRGIRVSREPSSQQVNRVMDRVLTQYPRMSGRRQSLLEMEIRDEIKRRAGNRIRGPF
jgi:hypothetical protein